MQVGLERQQRADKGGGQVEWGGKERKRRVE